MTYEMEIEQGLSFARAQLAKRLTDPESDPARVADVALATLALVAALSQRHVPKTRREERVSSGTPCLKLYREE